MDFDWNNPPFNLDPSLSLGHIEESFEDPFAVRLLPDSPRFEFTHGFSIWRRRQRAGDFYRVLDQWEAGARDFRAALRAGGEVPLPAAGFRTPWHNRI